MLLFAALVAVTVCNIGCSHRCSRAHEHEPIGAHLEVQARCLGGGEDAVHDGGDDDVRT